jgi:hypothetical protein
MYPNYWLKGAMRDMAVTTVVKDWVVAKGSSRLIFVS